MKDQTLNQAFPIVAAALANQLGITVQVGGDNAYTNGQLIGLPAYSSDDPDYKAVAWGYLAHEAGHIRHTDFEVFANASTSAIRKSILNILEDIRIEKRMQALYPGTKRTTEKVVEHLVATDGFELMIAVDDSVQSCQTIRAIPVVQLTLQSIRTNCPKNVCGNC